MKNYDNQTEARHEWLRGERIKESAWWWSIAIVLLVILFGLYAFVQPSQ